MINVISEFFIAVTIIKIMILPSLISRIQEIEDDFKADKFTEVNFEKSLEI